jgi:glycosyltransferase involved in cell wall biosynthesis
MEIIVGAIIKNEANRYLTRFMESITKFADKIIIIDDGSTDNSMEICKIYTPYVYKSEELFIKDESILRKMLWDYCISYVKDDFNTWIAILDADEIIDVDYIDKIRIYIECANKTLSDSIGYKFYDMWNETQYRDDNLWRAHRDFLVHFIKYNPYRNYKWNNKKLHCGRLPVNAFCNIFPTNIKVKHLGYVKEEDRKKKYKSYMKLDPEGKYGIMKQYKSILDKNINLVDF